MIVKTSLGQSSYLFLEEMRTIHINLSNWWKEGDREGLQPGKRRGDGEEPQSHRGKQLPSIGKWVHDDSINM